jgi:catechol 2,3-dioxygenase-like lactoylglutathione lyase family enzyme
MPVELNHTIIDAADAERSARWFADVFGLPDPQQSGPFWQVDTANGVGLDFDSVGQGTLIKGTHYAFLISEQEFDAIYGRIVAGGIEHWADPSARHPGEINHNDGGRGVYFKSPDGHFLEILTRPYGSDTWGT